MHAPALGGAFEANWYDGAPASCEVVMRTPSIAAESVRQLAWDATGTNAEPIVLARDFVPGADPRDCFPTVAAVVTERGGRARYGWRIAEEDGLFLEAEFHAVWERPDGVLIDVSPPTAPSATTLFVPDPDRVYEGRQVNSVRVALLDHPTVYEHFAAQDAKFEVENRGERADAHELRLSGADAVEYEHILARAERAKQAVLQMPRPKPGRNDPCPCGSGLKYKRCHGRG